MLNYLNIKATERQSGIKGLLLRLKRDRITVELKSSRGVCVKQVTYESFNGRVDLSRLENIFRGDKARLLCSQELRFPEGSGFSRFESCEFKTRLCTNMVPAILKSCTYADRLRVGIYDKNGENSDILCHILGFCSDVSVVTDNEEPYYCELERAMSEMGASAVVTHSESALCDCDLIAVCGDIKKPFPVRDNALLLAPARPSAPQKGVIYYKYYPKVPNVFESIKPKALDGEYFCSALYTLEHQYQLGSIVPLLCSGGAAAQTAKSLAEYLDGQYRKKTKKTSD